MVENPACLTIRICSSSGTDVPKKIASMQILGFMEVNLLLSIGMVLSTFYSTLGQPRDEMLLSKRKQDQRWNCCEQSSCHCPTEVQVAKLGLEILYTIGKQP